MCGFDNIPFLVHFLDFWYWYRKFFVCPIEITRRDFKKLIKSLIVTWKMFQLPIYLQIATPLYQCCLSTSNMFVNIRSLGMCPNMEERLLLFSFLLSFLFLLIRYHQWYRHWFQRSWSISSVNGNLINWSITSGFEWAYKFVHRIPYLRGTIVYG